MTNIITFTAEDGIESGTYTAKVMCGEAEPKTVTITVIVPEPPQPGITVDTNAVTVELSSASVTSTASVTVTKDPELAEEDLTVEITGGQMITSSIDQETGVITFTGNRTTTHIGNYVATISCGEAEPVDVTITVTAPAVTSISSSRPNKSTYVDQQVYIDIDRNPNFSQGDMTCEILSDSELYNVEVDQYYAITSGRWRARFYFTKTEAGTESVNNLVFTCNGHTLNGSITISE